MATVRIQEPTDSAALTPPELPPLGKTVGVVAGLRHGVTVTPGTGNWKTLEETARNLDGYDFDAWRQLFDASVAE